MDAIGNLHGATEIPFEALGQSDMLKIMCPTWFEPVENKRSDPVIHAFVTKCRTKRKADLMDEARATFTFNGEPDTHLVLSNHERRRINMERNLLTSLPDVKILDANDSKIYLHVGLKLQGCIPPNHTGYAMGFFTKLRASTTTP